MNSLKNKIIFFLARAKKTLSFWRQSSVSQEEIDRKLIYGLATRKVPSGGQLKHLPKFLRPKEYLVVKICLLLIVINVVYLGVSFVRKHLEYSPQAGGDYTEGIVGYPQTINPLYAASRDVDGDLTRLIYSSLFVYDKDGRLANDLVDSYVVGPDGKEYTVKIKPDVYWHNGDRLTAEDVLFTFNLIQSPEFRSPLRSSFSGVQASLIDSQSLKFSLTESYAPFQELLTFGILSKNIWGDVDPSSIGLNNLNLKPVGSGPYQFKSFIRNTDGDLKEYRLTANNSYYGAKPYIKNIIFRFFPDYTQAIKALNDNQIDGLSYLPVSARSEVLAKNSLSFRELARPETVAIFFNKDKNKSLGDQEVRVALAQAIDKDRIITEIFSGDYQRLDGPIIPQNWAYNQQLKIYNYSAVDAAALIAKKPLTVTLTVVDSEQNIPVAQVVKDFWEQAGVKVNLKIVSSEEAPNIIRNRDFEALIYGEAVGGDPDVYAFWHSSQTGAAGFNLAGYSNPEVDKLLVDGRATVSSDQRLADYQKFQEIITADLPVIWLYSPSYTYIQTKKIKGFTGSVAIKPADRFADVVSWYINTHKKIAW